MKVLMTLAALPFLAIAGVATAGQPTALSDGQMDGVTAGFTSESTALADALGAVVTTATGTLSDVRKIGTATIDETTLNVYQSYAGSQSASGALRTLPAPTVIPVPVLPGF
jgi:hypothetical protein